MNHFQFGVVFYCRGRRTPPAFQLPCPLPHLCPGLLLGLIVFINIATLFSPLPSLQPEAYSLKPFFSLLSTFCITAAYAGDVRYVYDDLGRLIAVVDQTTGEAAIYQYMTQSATCSVSSVSLPVPSPFSTSLQRAERSARQSPLPGPGSAPRRVRTQ